MAEFISWTLLIMSGLFIFYWIISFLFLNLGFFLKAGVRTIEFFRLWLKPLFLLNFFWFLVIEIIFSLVYWTSFLLLSFIPFLSPAILLINGFDTPNPGIFSWLVYSVLIYIVVMIPYFVLQYKLSFYFKRTVFAKLAVDFNAKDAKFHGQSGDISLNQLLYTQLATKDSVVSGWVTKALKDHSSSPGNEDQRFTIQMTATDQMSWRVNDINAEFFEGLIEFEGEEKYTDNDGKVSYKTKLTKELFDGIVICLENILETPWSPAIFEIEQTSTLSKSKNRKKHKESFFIELYKETAFKIIATKTATTHDNSKPEQYVMPEILKVKTDSSFQYMMCEGKDIYLLLKTNLNNTAFDLNMNIPVKESIALFKQDLTLVHSAISEIHLILKSLEEYNSKYSENAA